MVSLFMFRNRQATDSATASVVCDSDGNLLLGNMFSARAVPQRWLTIYQLRNNLQIGTRAAGTPSNTYFQYTPLYPLITVYFPAAVDALPMVVRDTIGSNI